jgi:2'-5' RNA ligase
MTSGWCHISPPHLTLVYAGIASELPASAYSDLGKDVLDLARRYLPQTLNVLSIEEFGSDTKVDALSFEATPDLLEMREFVEHWSRSEFPFNPHATIGPVGSAQGNIPAMVTFDRIALLWEDRGFNSYLSKPVSLQTSYGKGCY